MLQALYSVCGKCNVVVCNMAPGIAVCMPVPAMLEHAL